MVPRARRPTRRTLADESSPPVRRGAGKGSGGEGRRPGVGHLARARVRVPCARGGAAAPGGPSGRSVVLRGGGGERERGWPAVKVGGVGLAGAAPRLPRHTRPSAPSPRASRPPGMAARCRPPPAPRRVPANVVGLSRRVSLPPDLPATSSPRGLGPRRRGPGLAGPGLPRAPPSPVPVTPTPVRDRPTPRAEPPVRLGLGGVVWRWRGGGGSPWGAARPPARPPVAFPPPALGRFPAGRSGVLRSVPCAPSAGASGLCPRARDLASLRRPSGSLSLSLFPALPRCAPSPARLPASRRSPPLRPRWREGGPRDAGAGRARATGARGGWGSGAERAASGRERGEGLRPVSGTRVGGRRRAVAVVSRVAVGPAPGRGPASRAGSAEARVLAGGRGRRAVLVGVGAAGGVGAPRPRPAPPPRLARLSPLQVPSASRRGGLKTHGGSPVRLGVGAVGPAGSREAHLPSPPGSASPPPPPAAHHTGPGRRAAAGPPRRGRREGATRRPWCGPGPCAARPASPVCVCVRLGWGGAGGNPPGACGVSEPAPPAGSVPGAPS